MFYSWDQIYHDIDTIFHNNIYIAFENLTLGLNAWLWIKSILFLND